MAVCSNVIQPGKTVTVGWAAACGDDDHTSLTYLPLGTINSKALTYNAQTADTNNDLSGSVTSKIVTRMDLSLEVSGFLTSTDSVTSSQNELIKYLFAEVQAGRQPSAWVKISGPNYPRVWYIYMLYTGGDESFNTDDPVSGSFPFTVTDTGSTKESVFIVDPV